MTAVNSGNGNNNGTGGPALAAPARGPNPVPEGASPADAAERLESLGNELHGIGATRAASRMTRVAGIIRANPRTLNFADLERIIDPERVIDERADACGWRRSVRLAHWWRNIWVLFPITFTWFMLGWAALEYRSYLHGHPGDDGKPFLLLWQQGLGGNVLPFGWAAAINVILLAFVMGLTWWVHWTESSTEKFATSVYDAVGDLAEAVSRGAGGTPRTAEDWAREVDRIIHEAFTKTGQLAEQGEKVLIGASGLIKDLKDGSLELIQGLQDNGKGLVKDLQDGTQKTIDQFSVEVLNTLRSVSEQNEAFIKDTRRENEQFLKDVVQQQMRPLLNDMEALLAQFKTQQETYTVAVTGLKASVEAIGGSAARLAANAQEFTGSTRTVAGSLETMASSQQRFASQVEVSAGSMKTAATAMGEVKDKLQAVLVHGAEEMTSNITQASASLAQTQASVSETQSGLAATTAALLEAAANFREATTNLVPTTAGPDAIPDALTRLPDVITSLTVAITKATLVGRPRRFWWQRWRKTDGFGGL